MLDRERHAEAVARDPRGRRQHPLHHRRRRLGGAARGQPRTPASTCSGGSAARPRASSRPPRSSALGGQILGRLWPRNDEERKAAVDAGYDLERVLDVDDLVGGNDVFFAATGVTDGDLLDGVRYLGDGQATTESLVMRSRSGTVRTVRRDPRPGEAARGGHRRPLRLAGFERRRHLARAPAVADRRRDRLHRRHCSPAGCVDDGVAVRCPCAATRRRVAALDRPGREVRRADVLDRRLARGGARGCRASPTTSSTRWAAASTRDFAERDRARRRELRRGRRRGRRASGSSTSAASGRDSEHLDSRHETAAGAAEPAVPLTYFRAAAVIGAGSESFRTVSTWSARLPAMVTPRWVGDPDPADRDRRRGRLPARGAPTSTRRSSGEIEIGGPTSPPTAG